jgi:mono/diheme cytochrome c family protein
LKLKTWRLVIGLGGLLAAISAGSAQVRAADNSLSDNVVYKNNCAKCHGKTAEGRLFGGPSLVSEKVRATPADELMSIITNGKGHMPKYGGKLSEAEIRGLVEGIRGGGK